MSGPATSPSKADLFSPGLSRSSCRGDGDSPVRLRLRGRADRAGRGRMPASRTLLAGRGQCSVPDQCGWFPLPTLWMWWSARTAACCTRRGPRIRRALPPLRLLTRSPGRPAKSWWRRSYGGFARSSAVMRWPPSHRRALSSTRCTSLLRRPGKRSGTGFRSSTTVWWSRRSSRGCCCSGRSTSSSRPRWTRKPGPAGRVCLPGMSRGRRWGTPPANHCGACGVRHHAG